MSFTLPSLPKTLSEALGLPGYQQALTVSSKVDSRTAERVSHLTKLLPPALTKVSSYLDIGGGNCEITDGIAKTYSIQRSICSDVYPTSNYKPISNIQYMQNVSNTIGLPDQSLDLITAYMVLHHFTDQIRMFSEIRRVLRVGGYLFFREHDVLSNDMTTIKYLNDYHRQFDPQYPNGPFNYLSRDNLRTYLEQNGFRYIGSSDYAAKNPQKIYHSLFIRI